MKWISLKDRLTKYKKEVLVFYSGREYGDCKKPSIHILKYTDGRMSEKKEAEKWNKQVLGFTGTLLYAWSGFRIDLQRYITHWMPLPPYPTIK